jgi:mono/diheme cytochrome c family protein
MFAVLTAMSACTDEESPQTGARPASTGTVAPPPATATPSKVSRWYDPDAVARGAPIYAQNCSVCHGTSGQGAFNWRQKGRDGKYPAPPLNGTGHTWHHPLRALGHQIKFGAPGGSGAMPRFETRLTDQQVLDVIAWIQNEWPDKTYASWLEIEMRSRKGNQ